ncbi:MAG: TatD family hydrolase, partial [Alcanivoracaceae bacterium]|nr:TatD family hydrolase [Alcanivoracaceae bacterium]
MLLADIGVNLTDKRFDQDRSEVLQRAREAGVALQILTGTSVSSSAAALQLAESEPDLFCTAGIHPHQASEFSATSLKDLRQLASHDKVR